MNDETIVRIAHDVARFGRGKRNEAVHLIPLDDREQIAAVAILQKRKRIELAKKPEALAWKLALDAITDEARKMFGKKNGTCFVRERPTCDYNFGSWQYSLTHEQMMTLLESGSVTTGTWLDNKDALSPEEITQRRGEHQARENAYRTLTMDEWKVLGLAYGLDGGQRLSSAEILKETGWRRSKDDIDRLRRRATAKVKRAMEEQADWRRFNPTLWRKNLRRHSMKVIVEYAKQKQLAARLRKRGT